MICARFLEERHREKAGLGGKVAIPNRSLLIYSIKKDGTMKD
jgi:hypothetical protein